MQKLINEKCRKLSKRVSFYAVDCRDCCGEIFVDLQKYNYAKVTSFLLTFSQAFFFHGFLLRLKILGPKVFFFLLKTLSWMESSKITLPKLESVLF